MYILCAYIAICAELILLSQSIRHCQCGMLLCVHYNKLYCSGTHMMSMTKFDSFQYLPYVLANQQCVHSCRELLEVVKNCVIHKFKNKK